MNCILVPIDGSEHSYKALDLAADLARLHVSKLLVAHVVTDREASLADRRAVEAEFSHELVERSRSARVGSGAANDLMMAGAIVEDHINVSRIINTILAENLMAKALEHLRESGVDEVEGLIVEGHPDEKIISLISARKVDTVVMGCRGNGRLGALLLGSVSQRVAHSAECTVVMVK